MPLVVSAARHWKLSVERFQGKVRVGAEWWIFYVKYLGLGGGRFQ